jgi:hypothetical protein
MSEFDHLSPTELKRARIVGVIALALILMGVGSYLLTQSLFAFGFVVAAMLVVLIFHLIPTIVERAKRGWRGWWG